MKIIPNNHVIPQIIACGIFGSQNILPVIRYEIKNLREIKTEIIERMILPAKFILLGKIPLVITTIAKIMLNIDIKTPEFIFCLLFYNNEYN